MNSDSQEGNRGAYIVPSARQNIHTYCDIMGRYGMKNTYHRNHRANSPLSNEPDVDEVDNVMSKMQNVSPLQIRKKKKFRTNSFSQEFEDTDDNSSNMLSKSLPSTLSPHLYSSDDSLPEVNSSATSTSKLRLEDSDNNLYNIINESSSSRTRYQTDCAEEIAELSSAREKENNSSFIIIIFISLIVFVAAFYCNLPVKIQSLQSSILKSTQTINYDEILFERSMDNLREKYNIDHNLILKLKTGLSTIFSKMDAGSFMFVYNSNTGNFDTLQFEKFINEVVYTAARYLRNDITSIKHSVVLSSNLKMEEHGELINRYREDVDKTGVLLVKEIDGVPSELAMAFHYYCDEYDPLVKRSAIFFTLNLANCSNTSDKMSTHDFIEKCLASKWKTVPPENMRPLLTRVVDIIIDVTSVF